MLSDASWCLLSKRDGSPAMWCMCYECKVGQDEPCAELIPGYHNLPLRQDRGPASKWIVIKSVSNQHLTCCRERRRAVKQKTEARSV